jgi:serine/threonine protein kinase
MPTESGTRDYGRFDELAEEFVERFRRGERPGLQEYIDRLPAMAEEIREMFPALVEVEQIEEDARDDALRPPPPAVPCLGQIGDYRILREVGRGGMGVVYEAEQVSLGRRVALKVLPGPASGNRVVQERFRREARAAARLHHTNIVPVYEVGQHEDVRFYAMQFIDGQGLDTVIAELLQRHLDRAGSQSGIKAASGGRSSRSRGEPSRHGIDTPTLDAGVEVSAVLRSLLSGRFDPGGRALDRERASASMPAGTVAGGLATPTGIETESPSAGPDGALTCTDAGSAPPGDPAGRIPAQPPEPAVSTSAAPSSSSAILPGGTQLSSVESGRRTFFRSVAQIGRQVAAGLAHAHARGIVHRDIKPSNLLLDTEGVVWIADFGLAKGEDEGLTQSGDILGTLRYMAPERFRGEGDARADVYALGLTLYELLTLRPGFESSDRLELIERIKTEEPARPRSVDGRIPRDLETIVLKAIEKDPKARYQTAEAMGEDLRRFLADEPIKARQVGAAEHYWRWARRNPVIAVLGGVLTAVLVASTLGSIVAAAYFRILGNRAETARDQAQWARD